MGVVEDTPWEQDEDHRARRSDPRRPQP